MALVFQTNTEAMQTALKRLVTELKKDASTEVKRQAKLLALDVATAAPPRPKGFKGLAAGIKNAKARSWLKVVKALVKPAYSMRVLDVARRHDTDTLWGIATTTKRNPLMKSSAINRIVMAAKNDAVKAMKNLRQILKGKMDAGEAGNAVIYQDMNGEAQTHYYRLVDMMGKMKGKGKLGQIPMSQRVYLREPIKAERQKIMAAYIPTIGTVKAGWVQAAMAIPSNAGRKPPAWLLGKKAIGTGTVNGSGMKISVTIKNTKGNAKGLDDRTEYVQKAIRFRTRKMHNAIIGALSRALARKYRQMGQPVPAKLQFANRPGDENDTINL